MQCCQSSVLLRFSYFPIVVRSVASFNISNLVNLGDLSRVLGAQARVLSLQLPVEAVYDQPHEHRHTCNTSNCVSLAGVLVTCSVPTAVHDQPLEHRHTCNTSNCVSLAGLLVTCSVPTAVHDQPHEHRHTCNTNNCVSLAGVLVTCSVPTAVHDQPHEHRHTCNTSNC